MDRRTIPYIGVTGFMYRSDIEACLAAMEGVPRLLMVGILVSLKSLCGKTTKRPRRYPSTRSFSDLFLDHPQALNLVHYNTDRPGSLAGQLTALMVMAGPNCHGVQLNIAWPDLDQLKIFREEFPQARVVLQCGAQALERVAGPFSFLDELRPYVYAKVIDDVLLDPSGGLGRPFEPAVLGPYLETMQREVTSDTPFGMGVAGGLSASTLDLVAPLLQQCPDLNFDAEGRLRDAQDDLDLDQACLYLKQSAALLRSVPA